MKTTRNRYPASFVPPFVFERLARHGGPEQARRARAALARDASFRTARIAAQQALGFDAPTTRSDQISQDAPEALDPERRIHDARNGTELPGALVRAEGEPATGDLSVGEAYEGTGAVWRLFADVYGRASYDDEGSPVVATVNYGIEYANAFWNGEQLAFGGGDGELFRRFTAAPDVVAHEFTHGVVQYGPNLVYRDESGALNEHLCDVFGALTEQWTRSQTAEDADWLVGEGIFTDAVEGRALRSMAEPGTAFDDPVLGSDPQVARMDDYVETEEDNGGVHINSGIPNKAFHAAATDIGGFAWEAAGRVWYEAMTDPALGPRSGFRDFARLTLNAAGALFDDGSAERTAVERAWASVGLGGSPRE